MGGKLSRRGSYNLEKKEKEKSKLNGRTSSVLSLSLTQIYEDEFETPERDAAKTGIDKKIDEDKEEEEYDSHEINSNTKDTQISNEVTTRDDSILEERWKNVLNEGYWTDQDKNKEDSKMEQVEVEEKLDKAHTRDDCEQVEVEDYNSGDDMILSRKDSAGKARSKLTEVINKKDDKSCIRQESCEAQVEVDEIHCGDDMILSRNDSAEEARSKQTEVINKKDDQSCIRQESCEAQVEVAEIHSKQEEIQTKPGISQPSNGETISKGITNKIVKENALKLSNVMFKEDSEDLEFYDAEDSLTYEQVEVINRTASTNSLPKSESNKVDSLNNNSFKAQDNGELIKNVEDKFKPSDIIISNAEIKNFEAAVTTEKETINLESNKDNLKQAMSNSDQLLIDIINVKTEIMDYEATDNIKLLLDHDNYNGENNKIFDIPMNRMEHIKDGCSQPEIKNDTRTNISDIDIINNVNNNILHNLKTSLNLPLLNTNNIGDINSFSETFIISSNDPCYKNNITSVLHQEISECENLHIQLSSNLSDEKEKKSPESIIIKPALTPEEIAKDQMKLWVKDETLNEETILKINSIISRVNQVKYEIDSLESSENDKEDVRTSVYQTLIRLMRDVNNINTQNYNEKVIQLQHTALSQVHDCLAKLEIKKI